VNQRRRPAGIILLVIFFAAGAVVCLITILALAFPGNLLDPIWKLKPDARVQFLEIGRGASMALMAIVGAGCGLAANGLAKSAEWGRKLALAILIINLIDDSLNALIRHDPKTLIGLPIGALIIWYLVRMKHART
jgi:hypothetical protein